MLVYQYTCVHHIHMPKKPTSAIITSQSQHKYISKLKAKDVKFSSSQRSNRSWLIYSSNTNLISQTHKNLWLSTIPQIREQTGCFKMSMVDMFSLRPLKSTSETGRLYLLSSMLAGSPINPCTALERDDMVWSQWSKHKWQSKTNTRREFLAMTLGAMITPLATDTPGNGTCQCLHHRQASELLPCCSRMLQRKREEAEKVMLCLA